MNTKETEVLEKYAIWNKRLNYASEHLRFENDAYQSFLCAGCSAGR